MLTRYWYLTLSLVFLLAGTNAQADMVTLFTNWTTIDLSADTASGTLNGISVSLSGYDLWYGVTDGTSTNFSNEDVFDPALPLSDLVEVTAPYTTTFTYTVTFGSPIEDPIMHLYSLGSILEFDGITLTKVSGEDEFVVSGNTVTGEVLNPNPVYGGTDRNGTILLNGTFSSFTFTAHCPTDLYNDRDGIDVQIGAVFPEPVPVPGALLLGSMGIALTVGLLRKRRVI